MSKDYYSILGVAKNATEDDIKKAFRKISKENHPDLQTGKTDAEKKAAEAKFKEAAEAYETLSNKEKRQDYDMRQNGDPDFGAFFRSKSSMFNDVFNNGGFSFTHHFNTNPFGPENNSSYDPNGPESGKNVQIKLDVTFNESLFGVTKEFDIDIEDVCPGCNGTGAANGHKIEKCPHCNGTGMFTQQHGNIFMQSTCMYCHGEGYHNDHPCGTCYGSKRVSKKKHIVVNIPAGVDTGTKLKDPGKGQSGLKGGKNGDLFIIVNVQQSDLFKRNGLNLMTKVYLSPILASIGGKQDVYTPYGTSTIKIPVGTYNGQVFRLAGKGIKAKSGIGDLYVEVELEPLVNLTSDQVKLLDSLNQTITMHNLKKSEQLNKKLQTVAK